MTLHINRFVDKVKAAESRSQRDVLMTINEARDLHADITRLLLELQTMHERAQKSTESDVVSVELAGGTF
jgi:hypothetical protein